ncbi:Baculoviral IAP repeat-containing protein 6 [Mactra antiquata]
MASLTGKHQWYVGEDGCISIGEPAKSVTYHSALNSIIVTTQEPAVKVYDVTSGTVLQKSDLSAKVGEQVSTQYLPEKNRIIFCDSTSLGVRGDLQGVLLLDTALQTPLSSPKDKVRLELPLAEASQFLKSLTSVKNPEPVDIVVQELQHKIDIVQEATKGNHKTAKWATVCLELPYHELESASSNLVVLIKRLNAPQPGLSIASAVTDRLGYLFPKCDNDGNDGQINRLKMFSEAARRDTFSKWPHMNYKWALPDPMAQAGFYHQPNLSGDDRAMCFTCNVCLVCWEPTDEPWSEHERHSPSCPFVKGEHTQNVPLSVTYATQPAVQHSDSGEKIQCISTTCSEDYIATSTKHGHVVVWNLKQKMKKHSQFVIDPTEIPIMLKTGLIVDRDIKKRTYTSIHTELMMEDSLELPSGAEGAQEDEVDAKRIHTPSDIKFSVGENNLKEELMEISLHEKPSSLDNSKPFQRPNNDIEVTSLCIVEKNENDGNIESCTAKSSKKDRSSKVKRRPIQPSVICGASLRRPKYQSNSDDITISSNVQTDVQLMNKVNESVSGETSPQIITDAELEAKTESVLTEHEDDVLSTSTNFVPYLLVLSVKEDIKKISKQPSTDSLKPSTSTGNMIGTLDSMTNPAEWSIGDLYDSDPDVQIVKVTPAPTSLSTSSPTESSQHDGLDESTSSGNCQKISIPERAIKRLSALKSGTVLQCVEFPSYLQSEHLEVSSISPTLDKLHLVVVLSPRTKCSVDVANSSTAPSETSASTSDPSIVVIDTNSESQTDSSKLSSGFSEMSDASCSNENMNTNSLDKNSDSSCTLGAILIYKFNYDNDSSYATIEEKPLVVCNMDELDGAIDKVFVLPGEVCEEIEDDEILHCEDEIFVSTPAFDVRSAGQCGQLAVIHTSGKVTILNISDLTQLASIQPPNGDKFIDVTFCSGIDRLCLCSSQGKLYFYQISEEIPDQSDSIIDGDLTPTIDLADPGLTSDSIHGDDSVDQSPKSSSSELLAKQSLTFESLNHVYNLIKFENLMPRFTATVPPCWTEMQQEQQQRRHPQHLQHQGEATQHTRSWKLQSDSNTWDEHLFEIVLPRVCCVGHVDVKFSIYPWCPLTPNIQITLLKQNISAIGRQTKSGPEAASTPVDSKINFCLGQAYKSDDSDAPCSSTTVHVINNVLDPQFLESHNAEILCGPIDISDCLDLSGNSGLVSLTSPQLLLSKPRSFLLHIKGFPSKAIEQHAEKYKDIKKKRTAAQASDKNKFKTLKALFENYNSTSGSKNKMENLKGCDWLTEISITIRKTKKTNVPRERIQRNAVIDLPSFHNKLLSCVAFDEGFILTGVSPDHVQNMCLDILTWITNIQMKDPDTRLLSRSILSPIQVKLTGIIKACFIQGTRTTSHKCSRLLTQCMQFSKHCLDTDYSPVFSQSLLEALIDCLPLLPCSYSAGAVKWYFTLLNRVKCMDVDNLSSKCATLMTTISKHFHERATPHHATLKARYGLNGHPFESDLFDVEIPQAVKQIIPGNQPASSFPSSVGGTNTSSSSANTGAGTQQQDDADFYDFFNSTSEKPTKTLLEHARNNVLGMLEVEPLHFTCHSTSDGTKMERLDSTGTSSSTAVINPGLGTTSLGNMPGTINFGESPPYSSAHLTSSLPYNLPQSMSAAKQMQEKSNQSVKHKVMYIKQMLHEVKKNLPPSVQKTPSGSSELMPSTPKTTPQVMTPPLTPPNEAWHQIFLQGDKTDSTKTSSQSRPSLSVQPTNTLLQHPPPQVLVIERIYSGARRFAILDFGKPVVLTDVIIPLCEDLASLSIDVWIHGEEPDGQRLVVASDIGVRSLVMNNIMPPPVCRYLKITTIGRYGSGTTRSKIPIGAFYGHSYILPWEWSGKVDQHNTSSYTSSTCQLDLPAQSQLLSHLGSFMSLLEDIQCRYSLARARLTSLVQIVQSMQYANFHTQYYLKKTKNNDEDNGIIQAYSECLQLQLQQNLAMRAIDRLQSAIGLRVPTTQYPTDQSLILKQASTDKLRCILENLLETLISVTTTSSSILRPPVSLYICMDHTVCMDVFKYLCFHGTPRLQILTGMVLVRVCGSQPWFGDFLGNMMQEYFHSETSQVFSQDRVFILLTAMGQKALQGPSSVKIMESLLSMLAKVLKPIHCMSAGVMSPSGQLDLTLIGWILLFMCRNLDNTIATLGNGDEEGASAKKSTGSNLSNRWNFIGANGNVKSQMNKSQSVKMYRRSLHKRLLHHKQKLLDIDHMKKNFMAQEQSSNMSGLKSHGKHFWKELTQFASKHLKDIIQIRKTDAEVLRKLPRDERFAEEKDVLEYEQDSVLILPKDKCLPVVHGLMALLLGMDFTCNVDLFLITCKVLARICISTRPAITLSEAMNQDQLERLIMLASSQEFNHGNISWGGPWAGHSLTCLLQDILEGERVFPCNQYDGITDDDISSQVTDDSLHNTSTLDLTADTPDTSMNDSLSLSTIEAPSNTDIQDTSITDNDLSLGQGKDDSDTFDKESMMVDMMLDDGDDDSDDIPEKLHAYVTGENTPPTSTSMANSITNAADIQYEKYKPIKEGLGMKAVKAVLNFGSTGYPKPPIVDTKQTQSTSTSQLTSSTGQGLSTALDARLEVGLETQSELRLRMMLSMQSDTLTNAFTSPLPLPSNDSHRDSQLRSSPSDIDIESGSSISINSSFDMLSSAYNNLFSQILLRRVSMDPLLQLWLTLNEESSIETTDSSQPQFDSSRSPMITMSVTSVTNLLASVAMQPSLPVRTWVLVFQSLTLLANQKIGSEGQRSMVVAMLGDGNLVAIITKFLSGTSMSAPLSSFESNSQVGPSAVKAFHMFLQRLRVCIWGEEDTHNLKEIMLKLVYSLTAERGAFHCNLGPLDAQCKFLEFILELAYEQVDVNNAISVIESVSVLVHRHILCQERVYCRSTSDNGVNARSCFVGVFASLLRGNDGSSKNGDSSRDSLMCSLLKLVNKLLQVHFPSRFGTRQPMNLDSLSENHTTVSGNLSEAVTDTTKLSQARVSSSPRATSFVGQSDEEKVGQVSSEPESVAQTDEQKTESAQQDRSNESQGINLSDIILDRQAIMGNLIQALSYCNSNTLAMLLGTSGMPSNQQDSFSGGEPVSVGDGIYQILVTLSRQCSNSRHLMEALFVYLSGGYQAQGAASLCRLSEPLLWFILKVLDSAKMMKLFIDKGGVEVVCQNFVNCNSRIISTSPSLISTIMQNMNGHSNSDKKKKWEPDGMDGVQNFAPLGTIISCSPTASPAEVLIVSTPQHRRARSAPWSYHFYPDEAWVDLKITLPFAILLKEVQIQPHSPALSTCPAYVSLEASQDGVTTFPLCAPMNTSSLVFIKLQLQKSEVVTSVTIRLHRARDSMTIGLSQILLMGYSAFGDSGYKSSNIFLPTEDFVSRTSIGWVRLLHHCLTSQTDLESLVAEAAAPTRGLLNTCTALLVSPAAVVYSPIIESVLKKLGLHSGDLGLALIDNILRSNSGVSDSGMSSQYLGKMGGIANESTVEILYQLGTVQDRWTADRLKAMLQWLGDSAHVALQRQAVLTDDRFHHITPDISHIPGPASTHVHCIAAILWFNNETLIEYNLSKLITKDLVSCLYEWSCTLDIDSHLKKAVDYVLCAICHICPDSFTRIMEWIGIVISPEYGLTDSIPDDKKHDSRYHSLMTDDSKEASSAMNDDVDTNEQTTPVMLQEIKHMILDERHLFTLAHSCQSPLATRQLLESGFPAVLAQGLFEFCNRVISNFADSWSQPEGISDSCKTMNGTTAGDSTSTTSNHTGWTVTTDMVSSVLNFFSEISSIPTMKDWLGGADGNIFWPVLLTMLCNTPLHSPISVSTLPQKIELISASERACIETASLNFFRNVISCHIPNQMLFAKVLYDVIKEQGSTNKAAGLGICPLSGFTRRLFLQVLLQDETILVAFKASPKHWPFHVPVTHGCLQHPRYGAGIRYRTMQVNMHMTVGELTNKISDTPSLAARIFDVKNDKKSDESKESTCQIGLEIVDVIENMSALKTENGVPDKSQSTSSQSTKTGLPPRPPTRRGRNNTSMSKQFSIPILSLCHKLITNKSLPSELTLSQLINVLQGHGLTQGLNVLDFTLQVQTGPIDLRMDITDDIDDIPDSVLLSSATFPTSLQIFASVNGLALLAEHLPLLYPEISSQITSTESGETTPNANTTTDPNQDWVTVDSYPEDYYMLYEPMSPVPQTNRGHHIGNPTIPPHSLVAFGLFLRLPGYAEVLLKERKKAQCLLRLMLGVTDDGGGGQILTSPIASTLPTLPFIVLKSLFDTTPLTTDDGVLLRRMCLENGALHLILACLSVLSHHSPRVSVPGFQQEAYSILSSMQTPSSSPSQKPTTTEEKSQQYWAKGTGFGTGSTTSSWDAEQALIRQKSEEEHVTCLLQVLASYINPGGNVPDDFDSVDYEPSSERLLLPDIVPEMLTQSCLVPALSSYLRNDSVLDMARHVSLYRALLQLLRGISVCPSLITLLLPLDKENGVEAATAVSELLEKMRSCVDTYASRLKSNKGKMEEEEENEGLALLIPDIQDTARIVTIATDRLKQHEGTSSEDQVDEQETCTASSQESIDQIYLSEMQKLQFDQYEMVTDEGNSVKFNVRHHYEKSVKAAGDVKNPTRIRRLAQEAVTLSTSLPLSVSSCVFVRCDEERLDIMKVLITGPEDTPYANGCFEFDVYFPQDYPNAPPYINLETTGNHTVRFNPNLYNDGKVCLSVLNTWHGRPEEKWSSQTSSFLQVLVSIQSLILVCEPYFNEPGYERSRGTQSGNASSREYDANIRQATVKWAILEQIKSPPPCFKEVVVKHFWLKRHKILRQCEEWIAEMETYCNDKRTGRTISHSTMALKKHYNQLREEFSKMQPPEGLENIEKGDIDPKEKHYNTDQNGASTSRDNTQIVAADNNANSVLTDNVANIVLMNDNDTNNISSAANC